MGYACPVCEDPQQDGRHLANHLAFTAILGDEAHEAWLDEHAPGWSEEGEAELAERVVEHAEQREFPQVFDDTTGQHDHRGDPDHERSGALFEDTDVRAPSGERVHDGRVDEDARAVLEEARELTREMLAEDDGGDDGEDDESETSEGSGSDGNGDDDTGDDEA